MRTSDAVSFLEPESSDVITIGFHPDVQDTEVLLHGELPAGAMGSASTLPDVTPPHGLEVFGLEYDLAAGDSRHELIHAARQNAR